MTLCCAIAAPARALTLALALGLLAGCAGLREKFTSPTSPTPAAESERVSPAPDLRIEVNAPGPLKALLERNLDLIRLSRADSEVKRDDIDETEWSRLIDATPNQVRDLLQTEGYFAPEVDIERTPGRGIGEPELLRLDVRPGPRAQIGRVTIEVQGDLERAAAAGDAYASRTLSQLREQWPMPSGSLFRNETWTGAKAAALAQLRGAGYANASWSGTSADVDSEQQQVRLFLVADSGPLFRLGELQIDGLVVHDLSTVRNIARLQIGEPVTETMLVEFQDRLQKSGLFEGISVTLENDAAKAERARVVVRVTEAPLQVYTFGVGISVDSGPRASVEHNWRRVLGYAASARNKFEWGQKRQFWEGELTSHARPGRWRNLVGGTIENLESDSDEVLSQRLRLGRTQDGQRNERLYFVEAERSRRTINDTGAISSALALSVAYHGVWRRLDDFVLPTQGFTFAGQIGVGRSRGSDAEDGPFVRAYGRLTGYLPFEWLGSTWYSQGRIEIGNVFLRPNMVVPESQKWRAGGDETVRGYSYRSLGPIVEGAVGGGTALLTTSLELAHPILASMPSLWGAVFVDAGNAANSFEELEPVTGVGLGVRWRSPVGPLRVDYAWGVESRKGRLHFSIGVTF